MNLIQIIILYLVCRFLYKLCINVFKKGPIDILVYLVTGGKLEDLVTQEKATGRLNFPMLFDKLCKMADKRPIEMCQIAAEEMGYRYITKDQIERDYNTWMKFGFQDEQLPQYLESFIIQGKDYIIGK